MHSTFLFLSLVSLAVGTRLAARAVRVEGNKSDEPRGPWTPFDIQSLAPKLSACENDYTSAKWTSKSTWPVVKEKGTKLCLGSGSMASKKPVVVETYPGEQFACNTDGWFSADDSTAWTKAATYHEFASTGWFSSRGYYMIKPLDGVCTERNPCGMTLVLHGDGDHGQQPIMPLFKALASDSGCRERLQSVLVFPQLPIGERWDDSNWQPLEEFVVPLTKSLLSDHERIVDDRRVSLAGFSDGASGALLGAIGYPDIFSAVMCSALILGPDTCEMAGGHWDVPDRSHLFADMKRRRDARIGSAKRSETNSKLKAITISKGTLDTKNVDVFLNRLGNILETSLLQTISTQVRLYAGIGHGTWTDDQMKWPGLFSLMVSGTCDLNSAGPECSAWWNSPKSKTVSTWMTFLRAHWVLCILVVVSALAVVSAIVSVYKYYITRSSSKRPDADIIKK